MDLEGEKGLTDNIKEDYEMVIGKFAEGILVIDSDMGIQFINKELKSFFEFSDQNGHLLEGFSQVLEKKLFKGYFYGENEPKQNGGAQQDQC